MKAIMAAIVAAILLSGCMTGEQVEKQAELDTVEKTCGAGDIQGIDKDTQITWSVGYIYISGRRVDTYPGPYDSVDYLNVLVKTGEYAGKNVTFFLGKSGATMKWEVFCAMVQHKGKWAVIPVRLGGPQ